MTLDEILSAAKEAGFCIFPVNKKDEFQDAWIETIKAFTKIIERKTIERCAAECESRKVKNAYTIDLYIGNNTLDHAAEAIRKLGEEMIYGSNYNLTQPNPLLCNRRENGC